MEVARVLSVKETHTLEKGVLEMNALPLLIDLSDRLWTKWMADHDETTYNLFVKTEAQITNLLQGPNAA